MGVEGANRDWNTRLEPSFSPVRRECAGDSIGSGILAIQLVANSSTKGLLLPESFRRKSPQLCVPQPLVSHGADTAPYALR